MGLLRRMRSKNDGEIDKILDAIQIPSFSTVVTRLLGMLRDDEVSAGEVARVLENDPGLTVRVLRTVNAAAHGLSTKVDSVSKAVALLGRSRVEGIVVSVAVKDSCPKASVHGLDESSFWRTASRRAGVARALAQRLHRETADEAFTAALLLDIGVPALAATHGKRYLEVYERWRTDPETDLARLEEDTFGHDHTAVGARMVSRWALPEALMQAVRDHHDGGEGIDDAAALRVASLLRDDPQGNGAGTILSACEAELKVPAEEVAQILAAAFHDADELARALS